MVLAVGWAGYLIPKALKHHDDLAMNRPVEEFSDSVRVVGASASRPAVPVTAAVPASATSAVVDVTTAPAGGASGVGPEAGPESVHAVPAAPAVRPLITRAAARRAARRRRRVLTGLLLALVAVTVTSYLGSTPWWSSAVPGGLIVVFLVVARLTVRAQQVRRAAPVQPVGHPYAAIIVTTPAQPVVPADVEPDLGREDTQGLSREQLAEAVAAPVPDDGGLWDPLPVTLPTYVNKARARRTVRTIEITGMTSSGHDAADTALARTAAEAAKTEALAESEVEAEERKAAGA